MYSVWKTFCIVQILHYDPIQKSQHIIPFQYSLPKRFMFCHLVKVWKVDTAEYFSSRLYRLQGIFSWSWQYCSHLIFIIYPIIWNHFDCNIVFFLSVFLFRFEIKFYANLGWSALFGPDRFGGVWYWWSKYSPACKHDHCWPPGSPFSIWSWERWSHTGQVSKIFSFVI